MIVECGMCQNLRQVESWDEKNIFICIICANILSEIRKEEIELEKKGFKTSKTFRLALFDMRRDNIGVDKINE